MPNKQSSKARTHVAKAAATQATAWSVTKAQICVAGGALLATVLAASPERVSAERTRSFEATVVASGVQDEQFTLAVPSQISDKHGDGILKLSLYGDFDAANESITIYLDGQLFGVVFNENTSDDNFGIAGDVGMNCSFHTIQATVPIATLQSLASDGHITVKTVSSAAVACGCLNPSGGAPAVIGWKVSGFLQLPTGAAEAATASLTDSRRGATISNLPSLSARLAGGGSPAVSGGGLSGGLSGGGGLVGAGTVSNGVIQFSTSLAELEHALSMDALGPDDDKTFEPSLEEISISVGDVGVWVGGSYSYFETEVANTDYQGAIALAQMGVDMRISDDVLVGVALFGDYISNDGGVDAQGHGLGFMAGPYVVANVASNLYLEALGSAGKVYNTLDVEGGGDVDYQSDRLLLTARLSGEWAQDAWTIRPSTRVTYYLEQQESFIDAEGDEIAAMTTALGELRAGPEFAYEMPLGESTARPFVGVEGVWTFLNDDQLISGAEVSNEELSASFSLGFDAMVGPISIRAAGRYDGIGADNYDAVTGELQLRLPLN